MVCSGLKLIIYKGLKMLVHDLNPPGFSPFLGAGHLQRLLAVGDHGQRVHGLKLDQGAVLVSQHQLVLVEHHVGQVGQLQRVLIVAEITAIFILLGAALADA